MENLFSINYLDLSSDARGYQALPEGKNGGCLRLNSKFAVHGLAELLGIEITEHMHKIFDIEDVKSFDNKEIFKIS